MGATKLFKTPWDLWEYFQKYKKEIEENPLKVQDWVGKEAKEIDRKHTKPLTWKGFEAFLFRQGLSKVKSKSIPEIDLDRYRYNIDDSYRDYIGIVRAIGSEMFDQKFSGAACGIYQQNIIARELGLSDTKEVTNFQRPILEGGKELPSDD